MPLLPPIAVFDLDGTLVDTAADLVAALNTALAHNSLPLAAHDTIAAFAGHGGRGMLNRHCETAGLSLAEDTVERVIADFLSAYEADIPGASLPYAGACSLLDDLADGGWRVAVCTNKPQRLADKLLSALALTNRFHAICGADRFAARKPDPLHLMETIRVAGGDPARAVMIGDSITDIDTARNAAMPSVAVTFGYSPVPVASLGPTKVIDAYDGETMALLRQLAGV
ncbi:MAG: HAD-IA family hydrolase [Rhizobiaceae bacterium]|jgi:phosphoglycolate phosphatase|nr:HAD-IA family hydrolase [Rhizobiaceae bacterium]